MTLESLAASGRREAATGRAVAELPVAPPARHRWRPPIWLALLVGFGGLTAAAAAVLVVMLDIAGRNTYELLRETTELRIDGLVRSLAAHLGPARAQVEYLAGLLGQGSFPIDDDRRLGDLLVGSLAAGDQLTGIGFVRQDLHGVRATRDSGANAENWLDRPEIRLAVRGGEADRDFAWGDVIFADTLGDSVITLRKSVFRGDRFVGVVVAAVSVAHLSSFLEAPEAAIPIRPFILLGHDQVLAHPMLAGGPRGLSADKPLPRLGEVEDPVLAAIWSPEVEDRSAILAQSQVTGRVIAVQGEHYGFLYRELTQYGPTPWLVGMYVRMADVGQQTRRLQWAEIIGAGALLISFAIALLLGRSFSRPIRRLADASQSIRELDLASRAPLPGSVFRELDAAAKAHNAMVAGLRWFQIYVPRSLVRLLISEGHTDELAPEERIVTVLFTDLADFTAIGRRLEPAQLAGFLNEHFALLAQCVEAEGGTIDKYIGDSLMAFWGAPAAQPDHALRGCRAALAIAERVRADNGRRRAAGLDTVRLRIGVHTGPAIAGNVGAPGRINYTLIGDTVNIAQRLEQAGKSQALPSDEVIALVSEATASALAGALPLTPAGETELRGRGETSKLYRLV